MDLARTGQKLFTDLHVAVYRLTRGVVGGRVGRMQNVVLTTTGRKSGQARHTPLTATMLGDRVILVASNGGAPKHPDWYRNLQVEPAVRIQIGSTTKDYTARTATPEERADLWAAVLETYKGYDTYQRRTDREIPLVVCELRS